MSGPITFAPDGTPIAAPAAVAVPPGYQLVPVGAPAPAPQMVAASAIAAGGGWSRAPRAALSVPPIVGLLVPIELEMEDGGKVQVQLMFGPEYAGANALPALLDALDAEGYPVKVWHKKRDDEGGNRYGNRGGGRQGWRR